MPVEIRMVPTRRQWDFITCPADIILFGGARGGAKTIGALLDFWYHAIAHGPSALGLMVRRQRTDLKDTQLAAMNIYGNAAEWKEHGSYSSSPTEPGCGSHISSPRRTRWRTKAFR